MFSLRTLQIVHRWISYGDDSQFRILWRLRVNLLKSSGSLAQVLLEIPDWSCRPTVTVVCSNSFLCNKKESDNEIRMSFHISMLAGLKYNVLVRAVKLIMLLKDRKDELAKVIGTLMSLLNPQKGVKPRVPKVSCVAVVCLMCVVSVSFFVMCSAWKSLVS